MPADSPSTPTPPPLTARRPHARTSAIHRALLTGLLGSIGARVEDRRRQEAGDYLGPRGVQFSVAPGSALYRKNAPWVMAAEIVQTNRLLARTVAKTHPDWIEKAAAHLVTRTHFEPHWVRESGQVAAFEKVTLQGLIIVPRRRVPYGPIDPRAAREIFIQNALVEGDVRSEPEFLRHNRRLLDQLTGLEARLRRRDLRPDPRILFAFYDARVPAEVHSMPAFEKWRRSAERSNPALLRMSLSELLGDTLADLHTEHYPDTLDLGGVVVPLSYRYEPGSPEDGVTVTVPMPLLQRLSPALAEWSIPGGRRELVTAMLKALPKRLRSALLPLSDVVDIVLRDLTAGPNSLRETIARAVQRITGIVIADADWNLSLLPDHVRLNFRVIDDRDRPVASGRDLLQLQQSLAGVHSGAPNHAQQAPGIAATVERAGVTTWEFDDLPRTVEVLQHGARVTLYPALVDEGESIAVRLLHSPRAADEATRRGLRRLFALQVAGELRHMVDYLPDIDDLTVRYAPIGRGAQLRAALADLIADRAFLNFDSDVRNAEEFNRRLAAGWNRLWPATQEVRELVDAILKAWSALALMLDADIAPALHPAYADVRRHLDELMPPDFLVAIPWQRLRHYPRYLSAAAVRLRKLPGGGLERDRRLQAEFDAQWLRFSARRDDHRRRDLQDDAMDELRWLLEEYRVQLFAQELRTATPVSARRLEELWSQTHP